MKYKWIYYVGVAVLALAAFKYGSAKAKSSSHQSQNSAQTTATIQSPSGQMMFADNSMPSMPQMENEQNEPQMENEANEFEPQHVQQLGQPNFNMPVQCFFVNSQQFQCFFLNQIPTNFPTNFNPNSPNINPIINPNPINPFPNPTFPTSPIFPTNPVTPTPIFPNTPITSSFGTRAGASHFAAPPGSTVQVFGTGFAPSSPVQIILNRQLLRTQNTDLNGNTIFTMMMPFQASGPQTIQIVGLNGGSASVVIQALPVGSTAIPTNLTPPQLFFPNQTTQQQPPTM